MVQQNNGHNGHKLNVADFTAKTVEAHRKVSKGKKGISQRLFTYAFRYQFKREPDRALKQLERDGVIVIRPRKDGKDATIYLATDAPTPTVEQRAKELLVLVKAS